MDAGPMRVAEIWRYPVKSLQGERLESARVSELGIDGDRAFAIWDLESDLGLTARRVPELLFASATTLEDGSVRIRTPDGGIAEDDAALSDWLGRRVELRSVVSPGPRRFENPTDIEHESAESWHVFEGATSTFHDSERVRVSLLSTGTLRGHGWDRRRFRANLLLDGDRERDLGGNSVRIGDATLAVNEPISRCVMVTRPQPGGLGLDRDVLRTIAADEGGTLAMGATITSGGAVRVGDRVQATG